MKCGVRKAFLDKTKGTKLCSIKVDLNTDPASPRDEGLPAVTLFYFGASRHKPGILMQQNNTRLLNYQKKRKKQLLSLLLIMAKPSPWTCEVITEEACLRPKLRRLTRPKKWVAVTFCILERAPEFSTGHLLCCLLSHILIKQPACISNSTFSI